MRSAWRQHSKLAGSDHRRAKFVRPVAAIIRLMARQPAAILFFLLAAATPVAARVLPNPFPVPWLTRFAPPVTPAEYAAIRRAVSDEPSLGPLSKIQASRVDLGALGEALAVAFRGSPNCGATGNCPIWVFERGRGGRMRRIIEAGGWGFATLPSKGSVPQIAFYWNLAADWDDVTVFRYVRGGFVRQPDLQCRYNEDLTPLRGGGPACAAARRADDFSTARAGAPLGDIREQAVRALVFDCRVGGNCQVAICMWGESLDPKVVLGPVPAWAAAAEGVAGRDREYALVLARRIPDGRVELARYRFEGGRFLPDACEVTPVVSNRLAPSALAHRPVRAVPCEPAAPARARPAR